MASSDEESRFGGYNETSRSSSPRTLFGVGASVSVTGRRGNETRSSSSIGMQTPAAQIRGGVGGAGPSSTVGRRTLHTGRSTPSSTSRTLVEALDDNAIVGVVEGRGQAAGEVGMAYINLRIGTLTLCQFSDTPKYQRVIAKLNIFRPRQVIMPSTATEERGPASLLYTRIRNEASNVDIVPILRKNFSEGQGLTRVKQLVADKYASVVQKVTDKFYCLAAAAAVLKFAEIMHSLIFSPRAMKVEFQGSENTCMIDSKTAQHLELLVNNQHNILPHSVLGLLGNTKTPGGQRLLRVNILQPPWDVKFINERLDCVEELLESRDVLCGLQDILARAPMDIDYVLATLIQIPKGENGRLMEQRINALIALKHTLDLIPLLITLLQNMQNAVFRTIRTECQGPMYVSIAEKVRRVIADDVQVQRGLINMRRQRIFAVKQGVNPVLDIARKAFCEVVEEMNAYVSELSNKHDMSFRLTENMKRGFFMQLVLPGRGNEIPTLPPTFLQVSRHRNVISFTTQALLNYDRRCKDISTEIENLSAVVISDLISNIRRDISTLYTISEAFGKLDVLYSLSTYALNTTRCCRPSFSNYMTGITNGRHPVLELVKNGTAVPSNTILTNDTNFSLITGPNMSGKTTYLKQVATLQVLAQIGSFVPAESATFRIASNIFSRLGTGDNLEDNASSFMVELTEMQYILSNVDDKSLVIIDELARATSVDEGTALSWSIAEELKGTKAYVLFATHYLFLTKLEKLYPNVLNYRMETQEWRLKETTPGDVEVVPRSSEERNGDSSVNVFNDCKLKYTHVLQRGVTDVEYYGLKLASQSSFPSRVVANALAIAEKITLNRKRPDQSTNMNEAEVQQSHYLLGVQAMMFAEKVEDKTSENVQEYFRCLQKDFHFKMGTHPPASATSENNDEEEDDVQTSQEKGEQGSEADEHEPNNDDNEEHRLSQNEEEDAENNRSRAMTEEEQEMEVDDVEKEIEGQE